MIIEEYKPYIENMLLLEPWRDGPEAEGALCGGHIEWDGTRHWLCSDCGRIGTSLVQVHRRPVFTLAHRVFGLIWPLFFQGEPANAS
jgi:hypothetical protein